MSVKCKCGHETKEKFCCKCGKQVDGDSTVLQWIAECESRIMTWSEKQDKEGPETDAKEIAKTGAKLAMWRKRKQILEECQKNVAN